MSKVARPWRLTDFEEARRGMRDAAELRAVDPNGMPMAFAAALDSATMAGLLMALLDQAEAGSGESALDRIEVLLSEQVQLLRLNNEKIGALVTLLSSRASRAEAMRLVEEDEGLRSAEGHPNER